jgi:hypothetical protein
MANAFNGKAMQAQRCCQIGNREKKTPHNPHETSRAA